MVENIFQRALEILVTGEKAAVATMLPTPGFVPLRANRKLLITSAETLRDMVGSDSLVAEVWAAAQRVMEADQHSLRIIAEIIHVRNTAPIEGFPRRPRRRHAQRAATSAVC